RADRDARAVPPPARDESALPERWRLKREGDVARNAPSPTSQTSATRTHGLRWRERSPALIEAALPAVRPPRLLRAVVTFACSGLLSDPSASLTARKPPAY